MAAPQVSGAAALLFSLEAVGDGGGSPRERPDLERRAADRGPGRQDGERRAPRCRRGARNPLPAAERTWPRRAKWMPTAPGEAHHRIRDAPPTSRRTAEAIVTAHPAATPEATPGAQRLHGPARCRQEVGAGEGGCWPRAGCRVGKVSRSALRKHGGGAAALVVQLHQPRRRRRTPPPASSTSRWRRSRSQAPPLASARHAAADGGHGKYRIAPAAAPARARRGRALPGARAAAAGVAAGRRADRPRRPRRDVGSRTRCARRCAASTPSSTWRRRSATSRRSASRS